MPHPPCYLCKKRTPYCHGDCKDYLEWKKQFNKIMANKRKSEGHYE